MKLDIKDYDFLIFYKTWSNLMFICGGWKGNRFKCENRATPPERNPVCSAVDESHL
jgi:hypothetical protein